VRGFEAVRFCATLKATGVNIFRASAVRRELLQGAEALAGEIPGLGHAILFFKELWDTIRGQLQRFVAPIATCKFFEPVFAR
jgi:hypothetical protein